LSSGKDTELKAAKVEAAKNLDVQSGGDLRLTAATESHTQTDQGNHRKHLWKADWNSSSEEQRSLGSQLQGGNIALQTAALLRSEGAELNSAGDVKLAGKWTSLPPRAPVAVITTATPATWLAADSSARPATPTGPDPASGQQNQCGRQTDRQG
jgi:hypothetical protein